MNTKLQTIAILVLVMSLVLSGCGPGQLSGPALTPTQTAFPTMPPTATIVSSPTATPLPPTLTPVPLTATPTTPPTGISGTVKYTGTKLGSITVFVSTESGSTPLGEEGIKNFTDASGGEFLWGLPAGSYYVAALYQVGGPPSSDYPFVTCGPIEVNSNVLVKIEMILTDGTEAEMHGKPRDCGMKTP
jgi:hypothetical protein